MSPLPRCPELETRSPREKPSLSRQGLQGLCQAPTNLAVVRVPDQEAAAGTCVPDTDLAGIGATVKQRCGPVAERGQLARPHLLRDGLSAHLKGHEGSMGQQCPEAQPDPILRNTLQILAPGG